MRTTRRSFLKNGLWTTGVALAAGALPQAGRASADVASAELPRPPDAPAWARDARILSALYDDIPNLGRAKGAKATVKGVSTRGTETTDVYSLSGYSAAHSAIGKACYVKR